MPEVGITVEQNSYFGLFFAEPFIIWINPKVKDPELAHRVLLHELVHACLYRVGASQTLSTEAEEVICETMANFFSDYMESYLLRHVE